MKRRNLLKSLLVAPLALLGCKAKEEEPTDGRIPEGSVFPRNAWQIMELKADTLRFVVGQAKAQGPFGGHKEVIIGGDAALHIFFNGTPYRHEDGVEFTDCFTLDLGTKEDVRLAQGMLARLDEIFKLTAEEVKLCKTMAKNMHTEGLPEDEPRETCGPLADAQNRLSDLYCEIYDEEVLGPQQERAEAERIASMVPYIDKEVLVADKDRFPRMWFRRKLTRIEPHGDRPFGCVEPESDAMHFWELCSPITQEWEMDEKRRKLEKHIQDMMEELPWEVVDDGEPAYMLDKEGHEIIIGDYDPNDLIPQVPEVMLTPEQIREANAKLFEKLASNNEAMEREALDAVNGFTISRLRPHG